MLYLHLFSYFFHFRLYSTSRISDIAVPRFFILKFRESISFRRDYERGDFPVYFLRKDHELNLWATYWVIALFF